MKKGERFVMDIMQQNISKQINEKHLCVCVCVCVCDIILATKHRHR